MMLSLRIQVRCPPPRRRPPRYILATSICEFRPHANGALLRAAGDATHGCGTPAIPHRGHTSAGVRASLAAVCTTVAVAVISEY
jgi:hypothetical protein